MCFIEFSVILQHVFEKIGGVQLIGAAGGAAAAANAVVNLLHFFSPLVSHVLLPGRTAQQLRQTGDGIDLDAFPAGHTIAAATAEISGKLFPVFLNFLLQRFRQCGRTGLIGQEAANRIEKTISEQGFEVRRMKKAEIKRFLALYFEASMSGEAMPDIDGGQFFEEYEDETA